MKQVQRRMFVRSIVLAGASVPLAGCFGRNRVRRRTRRRGNREADRLEKDLEKAEAENAELRKQLKNCKSAG